MENEAKKRKLSEDSVVGNKSGEDEKSSRVAEGGKRREGR